MLWWINLDPEPRMRVILSRSRRVACLRMQRVSQWSAAESYHLSRMFSLVVFKKSLELCLFVVDFFFLFGEKICCSLNKYLYMLINNKIYLGLREPLKQVQIIYQILFFFFLLVPRTIRLAGLEFKGEKRRTICVAGRRKHELLLAYWEWMLWLLGWLKYGASHPPFVIFLLVRHPRVNPPALVFLIWEDLLVNM